MDKADRMDDEPDDAPDAPLPSAVADAAKHERIHFGSLAGQVADDEKTSEKEVPTKSGGTSLSALPVISRELGEESKVALERHESLLKEVERLTRARTIAVPTNDRQVKLRLRELGHPICLFGEDAMHRRDRLRQLLTKAVEEGRAVPGGPQLPTGLDQKDVGLKETVYSEGKPALRTARAEIARWSLPRARARLVKQRKHREDTTPFQENATGLRVCARMEGVCLQNSIMGDDRAVSCVQYSPDGKRVATGGWSSLVKIWDEKMNLEKQLRGHSERVCGVAWHPRAQELDEGAVKLVSCSADKTIKLWNLEKDTPVGTLAGHVDRVSKVAFHPMGNYLASTSFDLSWRLWDVATETELLTQDGHLKAVYALAFQCDGAILATGGLDALGRVWDLRTGRTALVLEGHIQGILSMDFSSDGYTVATGSGDNSIRVWDLRKRKCVNTVPAHSNSVTSVQYQPGSSKFLMSTSFDKTAKLWNATEWTPIRALAAHEGRINDGCLSPDGKTLLTASVDKTVKIWAQDDDGIQLMQF